LIHEIEHKTRISDMKGKRRFTALAMDRPPDPIDLSATVCVLRPPRAASRRSDRGSKGKIA
jgi:hypothetical protein